jgi:hypothetical protein
MKKIMIILSNMEYYPDRVVYKTDYIKICNSLHYGLDKKDTYEKSIQIQKTSNNINEAIHTSIMYMNNNKDIVAFTINDRSKRPWFHHTLFSEKIYNKKNKSNRKYCYDNYNIYVKV